jgi:hypothetical protein
VEVQLMMMLVHYHSSEERRRLRRRGGVLSAFVKTKTATAHCSALPGTCYFHFKRSIGL